MKITWISLSMWLALLIFGCRGREPGKEAAPLHQQYFGIPLPPSASQVILDKPGFLGQFVDRYLIIEYRLTRENMDRFLQTPPNGYSSWDRLKEIYIGKRLFSDRQMPRALIASKTKGREYTAIVVDPPSERVFAVYFSQ